MTTSVTFRAWRAVALVSAILTPSAMWWTGGIAVAAQSSAELTGTFRIRPGTCAGAGTFFRMILPTGSSQGPFVANEDSTCADKTVTTLAPGSDGGLVTGGYQPEPSPPFDGAGNSRATRLTQPVTFFGVQFSTSTNATDPQAGARASTPTIIADAAGRLSGNVEAFAASWNNQEFNQGAPKPGGSRPGLTSGPSGSYNATTGAFTLEWTSQIVGGPFNNFTGKWHFEGTFTASGTTSPPATRTSVTSAPAANVPPAPAGSPVTTAPKSVAQAGQTSTTSVTATSLPASSLGDRPAEAAAPVAVRTSTPVPLWVGLSVLLLGVVVVAGSVAGRAVVSRNR